MKGKERKGKERKGVYVRPQRADSRISNANSCTSLFSKLSECRLTRAWGSLFLTGKIILAILLMMVTVLVLRWSYDSDHPRYLNHL